MRSGHSSRRSSVAVAAALAMWLGCSGLASAEPPYIATCGTVRAFAEPTQTTAGAVTIGTATFALRSGDRFPSTTPVGAPMCINQTVTTSGPVLALIAMPSPICGEVLGVAAGIIRQGAEVLDVRTTTPDLRIGLMASPSLLLTFPGRASSVCFEVGFDANGNALATRVMGAIVPVSSATPAPPTRLPSTATDSSATVVVAGLIGASGLVLVLIARRRRASLTS